MVPPSHEDEAMEMTPVQTFYQNAVVFITGATGFVGKVLTEKLLYSCPQLDTIYYLVRMKKGMSISERHKILLKSSVFDRIRIEKPEVLDKLIPISGDITESGLKLTPEDRSLLLDKVRLVFHVAATVRFQEKLAVAYDSNVIATKRVLELCLEMKQLKAMVYVSTIFSNADKKGGTIKEIVYPPPTNISNVKEFCKKEERTQELLLPTFLGNHPFTYTFSKAVAETVVSEYANKFPLCIVRPSAVTPSANEPSPGWADNFLATMGVIVATTIGLYSTQMGKTEGFGDIIPVDYVANTIITAAWWTATVPEKDNMMVYNCGSSNLNPIKIGSFMDWAIKFGMVYPSKCILWYPRFKFRSSKLLYWMDILIHEAIPALVINFILLCKLQKPILLSIYRKNRMLRETTLFFVNNFWSFSNENMVRLSESLNTADKEAFPIDVRNLHWESYMEQYIVGIRKFILKDPLETLPQARLKLNLLWWCSNFYLSIFFYIILLGIIKLIQFVF